MTVEEEVAQLRVRVEALEQWRDAVMVAMDALKVAWMIDSQIADEPAGHARENLSKE